MKDERQITHYEKLWCQRLKRTMDAKPRTLEVYVALNNIIILDEGGQERCFADKEAESGLGDSDNLEEYALYAFRAEITGDASGL